MSETVEGFMRPCERCNGSGSRENPFDGFIRTCPECNGTGIHTEAPAQPPADTPPTFKQGDKVRVDNPGSALHNEEGEYQHELYTDHSAVIFPQLSKHAKSIWTHTLRLVEADTPPAAPSDVTPMSIYRELMAREEKARAMDAIENECPDCASRLVALNEKAEEARREWQRAENAEAERDDLRRKLEAVLDATYVFTEQLRVEEAMADEAGYQVSDSDEIPIIARYFRELFAAVEAAKKES